jgi:hypothetical protein
MIRHAGKILASLLLYLLTGADKIMKTLDSIGIKLFVLDGPKEHQLYFPLFIYLCCVVPVSVHYRWCSVTVCVKVLQNGTLVRFSRRADCWCAFRWSICNQIGHFIRCIQSSSFQGYDSIHKPWKDIII